MKLSDHVDQIRILTQKSFSKYFARLGITAKKMMEIERYEIRIAGFGGQGVVLSGYIIGKAYSVVEGKHATMIQSFGPEARGSACSATAPIAY